MTTRRRESTGIGDWIVETARRNPEALLVIAAGCALLMRGSGRQAAAEDDWADDRDEWDKWDDEFEDDEAELTAADEDAAGGVRERLSGVAGRVAEAAESAGDYAGEMGHRAYDTASAYASAAAEYAEEGRRRLSRQASRAGRRANQVWHEQPLAVLGVGLVAGAALAALIPPSETEERTLRPARDALAEAAARGAETVLRAAKETGRHMQEEVEERGFSAEGMKDLARDAAETFASGIMEKGEPEGGDKGGTAGAKNAGAAPRGAGTNGAKA